MLCVTFCSPHLQTKTYSFVFVASQLHLACGIIKLTHLEQTALSVRQNRSQNNYIMTEVDSRGGRKRRKFMPVIRKLCSTRILLTCSKEARTSVRSFQGFKDKCQLQKKFYDKITSPKVVV